MHTLRMHAAVLRPRPMHASSCSGVRRGAAAANLPGPMVHIVLDRPTHHTCWACTDQQVLMCPPPPSPTGVCRCTGACAALRPLHGRQTQPRSPHPSNRPHSPCESLAAAAMTPTKAIGDTYPGPPTTQAARSTQGMVPSRLESRGEICMLAGARGFGWCTPQHNTAQGGSAQVSSMHTPDILPLRWHRLCPATTRHASMDPCK
jgi:hypothetical protein